MLDQLDALRQRAVLAIGRLVFNDPRIDDPSSDYKHRSATLVESLEEANLVSSRTTRYAIDLDTAPTNNIRHAPVFDLDYAAHLVPSSTPGHYHLYLDTDLSHDQYMYLIDVLGSLGVIEKNYAKASIGRGQTFVRLPGVKKHAHRFQRTSQTNLCVCGKPEDDRYHKDSP